LIGPQKGPQGAATKKLGEICWPAAKEISVSSDGHRVGGATGHNTEGRIRGAGGGGRIEGRGAGANEERKVAGATWEREESDCSERESKEKNPSSAPGVASATRKVRSRVANAGLIGKEEE